MRKYKLIQRILAMGGVILLAALYISTLVLAIIGGERAQTLLKAAIACTFVVPVLLWAYSFIYRLLRDHYNVYDKKEDTDKE